MSKIVRPIEKQLGEEIHHRRLDCGLEVLVARKPGFERTYALLGVHYGSIDTEFVPRWTGKRTRVPAGIAHFLEHKMFEKEDGDVSDKLAAIGCSTNAMTSFNHTGYLIECTQNFEPGLEILIDFVSRPHFTETLVEKEKGIIKEEIDMYRDDPSWGGYMSVLANLYGSHPVAVDIAGTNESIMEIRAADLETCHAAFYVPGNMHLAVAGDVNVDRICAIAEEVFARNDREDSGAERRLPPPPKKPRRRRSSSEASVTAPKLHLGWRIPLESLTHPAYRVDIALDVFLKAVLGRSSKLYKNLYDTGLIDESFGYSASVENEFAFLMLAGDSRQPKKLERVLVEGFSAAIEEGIDAAALRRSRRSLYGSFVKGLDSVGTSCWNLIDCHAKDVGYLDYGRDLMRMKDDELLRIVRDALGAGLWSSHLIRPKQN